MKKTLAALLTLMLLLVSMNAFAAEPVLGGWTLNNIEPMKLTKEVTDALTKATENLEGALYEPVALLGSQVVSGMNYCILCKITPVVPDAVFGYSLVYIYADLEGNAKITNTVDLNIADLSEASLG